MKMITIKESESRLEKIDSLVEEGLFSSRSEAYRAGALFMILSEEAHKFARVGKLEKVLFGREVNRCLDAFSTEDIETASSLLLEIAEILRLRAVLSPLISGGDRESFRTLADGIGKYGKVLADYEKYDDITKKKIMYDVRRDLTAIKDYVDSLEEEPHAEVTKKTGFSEMKNVYYYNKWEKRNWSTSDNDAYSMGIEMRMVQ